MSKHLHLTGRRTFLRRAAGLTAYAGSPLALQLGAIGAAAAQTATDYKALVCIYLGGGNDQSNTLVPISDAEYAAYQASRPAIALSRATLLPLNLLDHAGPPLGLHPALSALSPLFDQGLCAAVANVGTLTVPTTLSDWRAKRVPLPLNLFSHSDQAAAWHTALPNMASRTGWLGRIGDLLASAYNPDSLASICLSLAGNNMIQAGLHTIQYQVTTKGPVLIDLLNPANSRYSAALGAAYDTMLDAGHTHIMAGELGVLGRRAMVAGQAMGAALAAAPAPTVVFPTTSLGQQLSMVARLISAREGLGQRRQIFYVASSGWDFHDNLLAGQQERLAELGNALGAFQAAMNELAVAPSVTAFTASDFGRALATNGRGADHGWGSHHLVLGGAVAGNRVYGQFPTVALGGPEDIGQGRLLPTTPLDRYAATLARWFGVSDSDLGTVLPRLSQFVDPAQSSLGFV